MRPSRGMGDINPTKQPRKTRVTRVTRKDSPQIVDVYAKGGACRPPKKR